MVEAHVVLGGEVHELFAGVAGLQQPRNIDGVADLGSGEQCAGLACGDVVAVEYRAEVGFDWCVVQEFGDEFPLLCVPEVVSVTFNLTV
ncbi:hypothetical protein AB0B12_23310 [Streptomyces sp. NPDC044780]|uniref:hypothetical protein n=1 Tax=unclassified Streptomyces TaxID=2593676 RepID=UPI0033CB70D8